MSTITVLGIAVSLAMDAFSVCIATGISLGKPKIQHYFRMSFAFGFFQFIMPIGGYFGGKVLEKIISDYDHWVAFFLLFLVGGKMIKESFEEGDEKSCTDPTKGMTLLMLAVATSIDAAAVGLGMGMLKVPIVIPSIIIGIVCAFFSVLGLLIGKKIGCYAGKWVERAGGLILIIIGAKILVEHIYA